MRSITNGLFRKCRIGFVLALPLALTVAARADELPAVKSRKPVVSDLIVRDNRRVSCEAIKKQMKTRVGKEFDDSVLQEDVRTLFATRRFANIYANKYEDGPGRIKVVIYLRDFPSLIETLTFVTVGAGGLSDDDLGDLAFIRKGMPCNPIVNKVACQNIARYYQEHGYPLAHCDLVKGGSLGDTEVKFEITLDEREPR